METPQRCSVLTQGYTEEIIQFKLSSPDSQSGPVSQYREVSTLCWALFWEWRKVRVLATKEIEAPLIKGNGDQLVSHIPAIDSSWKVKANALH